MLGLARSGRAAQAALEARGIEVVAADRTLGNDDDLSLLDGADVLVKSPGVPGEAPLVTAARERGIPVWSEIELGARLLDNPILAVTGTKGKTTTSELLGRILDAPVAGNVGRALTELVGAVEPGRPIVCEVVELPARGRARRSRPQVAVLLNLERDHLDRHGSLEAYRAAKLRIFENQGPHAFAVVPAGFGPTGGGATRIEFSGTDELPAEPLLPGPHNRANAAAAVAAARAWGADEAAIAAALVSFAGVPHRLETVAQIAGVRYVNDSIATNILAVAAALQTFDAPIHLILGGRPKGEPFDELARLVAESSVVTAYLIGEAAEALAVDLGYASVPFLLATTLERAVAEAASVADPGHVVLLSPACASYDQFSDFEQRGEEFRRLVENLE